MLELWYQSLEHSYRVENFIEDVKEWEQEGFLDEKIWTRLAQKIDLGVLPELPKKTVPKEQPSIIPSKEGKLTSNPLIQKN